MFPAALNQLKTLSIMAVAASAIVFTQTRCYAQGEAFSRAKPGPVKGQEYPTSENEEPKGRFPKSDFMKVAVLQVSVPPVPITTSVKDAQLTKDKNRRLLEKVIRTAAANGAKLIVTPELAATGYPDVPNVPDEDDNWRNVSDIQPYAETIPGPTTNFFAALARELGVYLQIGDIHTEDGKYYNAATVVDPNGSIVAVHHKNNLYGNESDYFTPGTESTTFSSPAGKIGVMICADVYDAKLPGRYRDNVQAVTLSAAWASAGTAWYYFTEGAQEMHAYLLAANNVYYPEAGIFTPNGDTQSRIFTKKYKIAYGYLPLHAWK